MSSYNFHSIKLIYSMSIRCPFNHGPGCITPYYNNPIIIAHGNHGMARKAGLPQQIRASLFMRGTLRDLRRRAFCKFSLKFSQTILIHCAHYLLSFLKVPYVNKLEIKWQHPACYDIIKTENQVDDQIIMKYNYLFILKSWHMIFILWHNYNW